MNNGLDNKLGSLDECINFCKYYFPGAKYFVWSDSRLGSPTYENACWCKDTK